MNGAYGEGLAAFDTIHRWFVVLWPFAVAAVGFAAGYITGGIVQRGQGMNNNGIYFWFGFTVGLVVAVGLQWVLA